MIVLRFHISKWFLYFLLEEQRRSILFIQQMLIGHYYGPDIVVGTEWQEERYTHCLWEVDNQVILWEIIVFSHAKNG